LSVDADLDPLRGVEEEGDVVGLRELVVLVACLEDAQRGVDAAQRGVDAAQIVRRRSGFAVTVRSGLREGARGGERGSW
jgi:hypothetical protein